MTLKCVVDGIYYGKNRTFPDLNNYINSCGRHPQIGGKIKREYQMIACNKIRTQIGYKVATKPVRIIYRYYEADKRRDKSNIGAFFVKVFEDALQQCGILSNDGWANINGYEQYFYVDKANPRVEVEIIEEE